MSNIKGTYPVTWRKMEKFNKRIPVKVNSIQFGLAKKFRKPGKDIFKSLKELYSFFDSFFEYSKGLVACKNGCSYCCHMEVGLYTVEAELIANEIGVPLQKLQDTPEYRQNGWIDMKRPCPFLVENSCSIYEVRPMVCRTHVNFEETNACCIPDIGSDQVPLMDRRKSFPGAMEAYETLVNIHGVNGADIRQFFSDSPALNAYRSKVNTNSGSTY